MIGPVVAALVAFSRPQPTPAQWSALVQCESTHRNVRGTYSGFFQFSARTWAAVSGLPGVAADYPPLVQWAEAIKLYNEQGASPWPRCGRWL